MLLNTFEFHLMNNPVRRLIQERYEMNRFMAMGVSHPQGEVLEIGCGNGNGARLIEKYLKPERILSIDLDEGMVDIARKRKGLEKASFLVMDASRLDFPDQQFDAVFDFGIIHHIPNWRDCILEIHRVLKKNGVAYIEELSRETFYTGTGRLWKKVLFHPYDSMFTEDEFIAALKETGFTITHYSRHNPLGLVRHFSLRAVRLT